LIFLQFFLCILTDCWLIQGCLGGVSAAYNLREDVQVRRCYSRTYGGKGLDKSRSL